MTTPPFSVHTRPPHHSTHSPVQVVLNILRQVNVKQDKVVEMTATEGLTAGPMDQAAAPLASTARGILTDLWCGLHVLQHRLQRHI